MSRTNHNQVNCLYPGLNLGHSHECHPGAEKIIFGFWIFLMADAMNFAMFFAIYNTALNSIAMAGGPGPKDIFDLQGTAIETGLLLLSSLTCGLVSLILKYQHSDIQPKQIIPIKKSQLILWLAITGLLGLAFVLHEFYSFYTMIYEQSAPPQRSGWLSAFFSLVGFHGLHMVAGILWTIVLLLQIKTQGLTVAVKMKIMRWALYWHFLDIVWIFIFSFVFLKGLIQ